MRYALMLLCLPFLFACQSEPEKPAVQPAVVSFEPLPQDCDYQAQALRDREREYSPRATVEACLDAVADYPKVARYQFQLGEALHRAKRNKEALAWWRKAARAGSAAAQREIGNAWYLGQYPELGMKRNYKRARGWLEQAAKGGDHKAQYSLGAMYEHGEGVRKDLEKAKKYYRKSAAQDNVMAVLAIRRLEPPTPSKAEGGWFAGLTQMLGERAENQQKAAPAKETKKSAADRKEAKASAGDAEQGKPEAAEKEDPWVRAARLRLQLDE